MQRISVVIPVRNGARDLQLCLAALNSSTVKPAEVIVIDDAGSDDSAAVAEAFGAVVLRNEIRSGPAKARNIGAQAASSPIVLFIDADVCVHTDTIERIQLDFERDPDLSALFGSYDAEPGSPDFLSWYKNFQHHFVHQHSRSEAATFWSGCGAVRREIFLSHGGFDVRYNRPAIEDIEFGARLKRAGGRIKLDKFVLVKHFKRWGFTKLVTTEVRDRAIPWTELLLSDGKIPNDLNLGIGQRVSAILVVLLVGTMIAGVYLLGSSFAAPFLAIGFLLLACYWADSVTNGTAAPVTLTLGLLLLVIELAAVRTDRFWMTPALMGAYAALFLRVLLFKRHSTWSIWSGIAIGMFIAGTIVRLLYLAPRHPLSLVMIACGAGVLWLNRSFYLRLGRSWGKLYAVSSIPFHMLYQLYSTFGFAVGVLRFYGRRLLRQPAR